MSTNSALLRPIVVVPIALALFLTAAAMIWISLQPRSNAPAAASDTHPQSTAIVVSTGNIEPGQILATGDLSLRAVDPAHVPAAALRQPADAQGHMALSSIPAGEPILTSDISNTAVLGIAAHVPVGYRAYAIPVSEADIVGGFLQVGDHVDLYVTLPGALFGNRDPVGRKPDDQSKSTLLLQGVTVLAVGTKLQTNGAADTTVRTVTLALERDALSKIALAARLGTITFAIRNPADQGAAGDRTADLDTLLGQNNPQQPAPTQGRSNPASTITIYAGRSRTAVHVP